MVSHDVNVLELTADRLWLVEAGTVRPFEGDLEDYRARILAADDAGDESRRPNAGEERKRARRAAAARRAALAPLQREITATERTIATLTATKNEIAEALSQPDVYAGDAQKALSLQTRFRQAERDLAAAEERWFDLQQALEEASAGAAS